MKCECGYDGSLMLVTSGVGWIRLRCPECGKDADYEAAEASE